ncbi:hypothetical protein BD626DRAFT_167600 [Schizophyllum amplum]|uniref:PH domain-containing protein n=1 Tax=Schizophyllum amplum TaxID=97359 RepID=A0A550CQC2_9AGAR|nr:hypothetical protein BD626DRAFT_167600 [Auriculariopsis ampla]
MAVISHESYQPRIFLQHQLFPQPTTFGARSTPQTQTSVTLPRRQTAAVLNRFLLEMSPPYKESRASQRVLTHSQRMSMQSQRASVQSQGALYRMLDNMMLDDQSPLPTESFPSSRRPSVDSCFDAWADDSPVPLPHDHTMGSSPECDVPALPSSHLSGRFSAALSTSSAVMSTSSSTVRPPRRISASTYGTQSASGSQRASANQRASVAQSASGSHSASGSSRERERALAEAERRFGGTPVDLNPSLERRSPALNYEAVKDSLAKRVVDWKGHSIDNFGRLLLADELVVMRMGVDYLYLVYIFERIVIFAAEGRTGRRQRQCFVGSRPPRSGTSFQAAALRSTPLNMKGRVFMMSVVCAVPASTGGMPCECTAALSASVSPHAAASDVSYPLALQFLDDEGGIETLTLHMPNETQRTQWQSTIEQASSRECAKYNAPR